MTERHRLNRRCCESVFNGLDRKIVLISWPAGSVLAVFVDAHDVINPATMAGNADNRRMRRGGAGRKQQIKNDSISRPAFETSQATTRVKRSSGNGSSGRR